jgi:hypothetical protein
MYKNNGWHELSSATQRRAHGGEESEHPRIDEQALWFHQDRDIVAADRGIH